MGKQRLTYIDVAKGIGILAIMLGHMGFVGTDGSNVVRPLVNQFHVPIFYVAAGMFLSTRKPLGVFVREKARRLLVPYAITCAVMGLFVMGSQLMTGVFKPPTIWNNLGEFALAALWGAGIPHHTLPPGVGYIGAIWFLEALFVALLEVRLLLGVRLPNGARFAVCLALALVALGTRRLLLPPFNVQQGLFGGLYVMIGYLYRTYVGLDWRPRWWLLVLLCVCCGVSYVHGFVVSCVTPSVAHGICGFAASLCACLLVLALSQLVSERLGVPTRALSFFGRHSLVVLCVYLRCLNLGIRLVVLNMTQPVVPKPAKSTIRSVDSALQLCPRVAILVLRKHNMR